MTDLKHDNFDRIRESKSQQIISKRTLILNKSGEYILVRNEGKLVDGEPVVTSSNMNFKLLSCEYFMNNTSFKRHQDITQTNHFIMFNDCDLIVSISHRWEDHGDPDPKNTQFNQIKNVLNLGVKIGVFYDFSCLPQHPRTSQEESLFKDQLQKMQYMYMMADQTVSLLTGDYFERAWCFMEWLVSSIMKNNAATNRNYDVLSIIKSDPMKVIDELLLTKRATNGADLAQIRNTLILTLSRSIIRELSKSKFFVYPRMGVDHMGTFQINRRTQVFSLSNSDLTPKHNQLILDTIKEKMPCLSKIPSCLLQPFVCCISYEKYDDMFNTISRIHPKFHVGMVVGETDVTIVVKVEYDHKFRFYFNPSNIDEVTHYMIESRYIDLHNLIDESDSGKLDGEVLHYLVRTNSVDYKVTAEFDEF